MTDVAVGRARPGLDRAGRDRTVAWLQEYGVYVAIVALLVVNAIITPSFLTAANFRVQAFQVVPTLIIALGMALVITTEGIDLSVGAVVALSSAMIPLYLGYGAWTAVLMALVAGCLSGLLAGLMVAVANVQPIIATLALMIGLRGLAVIMNGATAKSVDDSTIAGLGLDNLFGVPEMVWIAVVIVVILAFVVRRTAFGRRLTAIGDNRAASTLAGLPVKRVLVTVYIVSGLLAALAGVLFVGHGGYADPSNYGLNYELYAITAVVVGGTPLTGGRIKVLGTVAGAVFMQLVTATLVQHDIKNSWSQMIEAVIIIVAVYAARGRSGR
ncbi:ABC transporter permease [Luteimicrobium subarcticum]|uniref:Monosaccharide ABC transporter membrane protein (CUT2 family) n=1 Tax=Luteimicrobium subarcticum TaxID=620910 RepID=A0A2M8WSQ0_9MICO|nr:ABC transporter permease [Luteimicrobium subarcticum]PJI93924.1 monosaccharide ABC transporter membrane protein (CUT2 family) [Luteimicrobium subarcticum]